MQQTTRAHVPTENGSRYLQQLCKHWSHKLDVRFDAQHGEVRFGDAVCVMDADDQELTVTLSVDDPASTERMQQVVASHLDRFAFREAPLPFNWRPVADQA